MVLSFRKSKSIGPLRINVSKRGIGMSFGNGLCQIGMSPDGKTYMSGGVRGVRFRQSLGKFTNENHREVHPELPPGDQVKLLNAIVEYHGHLEAEVRGSRRRRFRAALIYMRVGWVLGVAMGMDRNPGVGVGVLGVGLVIWVVMRYRAGKKNLAERSIIMDEERHGTQP